MRPSSAIAVVALSALTLPVVVVAESKIEPHASSPAGAVYEIPLQTARGFGSPGGGSGTTGGGGRGVLPGTGVKSENGYGSSSRVPGLSAATARADASGASHMAAHAATAVVAAAASTGAAAGAAGSSGSAATTTGSGGAAQPTAPQPIQVTPASTDTPSLTNAYGLVALIVLGGAAAGLAAASATHRGRRST